MNRELLVISSQPLADQVASELEESNWIIRVAHTAQDARKVLDNHDFLVGLFLLWPNETDRYREDTLEIVKRTTGLRWIGGFDRGQLEHDAYLTLVTEHLHDFVTLPLDPVRLVVIVGHAYGMAELDRQFMAQQQAPLEGEFGLLGTSPPMLDLYEDIRKAAASDAPTIVFGETGSGKEAAARAIHAASTRAQGPFIPLQSAILPAMRPHPALGIEEPVFDVNTDIEQAFAEKNAGGTLFLDGINNLSAGAQARLLSLTDQETRLRTRGNDSSAPWEGARLRIICASDTDLEPLVHEGRFRCDLFYRLQVLSVRVPSLRERGDDVWLLARHFLEQFRQIHTSQITGFSKDSLALLALHDWPGNLRELRNRIHKAALSCPDSYILPAHLDLERRGPSRNRQKLQDARDNAERLAIEAAIKRNLLNLSQAADELGISRMTLYRLLEKHGIEIDR